jgi:IS5 family transposase
MNTPSFKKEMYRRNAIEGTISELIRAYGLRKARYRGLAKVRQQNHLIGIACNLKRLFRCITWGNTQSPAIRPSVN